MLASTLIIAISLVLLVYWFRYSCLLLLRSAAADLAESGLQRDARFSFADLQVRLQSEAELDPLHSSLNRDYQVLCYLLQHAAGLELGSIEDRILKMDYTVMHWYYRVTRTLFPDQARKALIEMATVLDVLAHKMGQQASA